MKSISDVVASGVRLASEVRGKRILHPRGEAFAATVRVLPAAGWIDLPLAVHGQNSELRAALRLSQGAGLPEGWPDVLGFALRIYDADSKGGVQDLLLSSSGARPGARHLLAPRCDPLDTSYSSITWCAVGERKLMVGAFPRTLLDRVTGARFELATAPVKGEWTSFAEVVVGDRLPEEEGLGLTFNPANSAGGIAADQLTRRIRSRAYPAARSAEH